MEKTSRPFPLFLLLPPGLGGDKSGPIGVGGFLWGKPGGRSPSPPPLFNILLQGWSSERSSPCAKNLDGDKAFVSFFFFLWEEQQKRKQQNTREMGQRGHEGRKNTPKSLTLPGCDNIALAPRSLSGDRNMRHPILEEG